MDWYSNINQYNWFAVCSGSSKQGEDSHARLTGIKGWREKGLVTDRQNRTGNQLQMGKNRKTKVQKGKQWSKHVVGRIKKKKWQQVKVASMLHANPTPPVSWNHSVIDQLCGGWKGGKVWTTLDSFFLKMCCITISGTTNYECLPVKTIWKFRYPRINSPLSSSVHSEQL